MRHAKVTFSTAMVGLFLMATIPKTIQAQGAGNALSFDGSDDYVSASDTGFPTGSSVRAAEMWAKVSSASSSITVMLAYGSGAIGQAFQISPAATYGGCGDKLAFTGWGSGYDACSTVDLRDDLWHHVAVVYNGGSGAGAIRFYVDGVDVTGSSPTTATLNTVTNVTIIGKHLTLADHYFDGTIDEVRIWNTALSQSTIQSWMHKEITTDHPNYSNSTNDNLKAYYKMSNGLGTSLSDNSANSNTGTISGASWNTSSTAPIGNLTSGYTTDAEAIWSTTGTSSSDASDGLSMKVGSSLSDGNFAVFANNNTSGTSTSDLPSGVDERTGRIWYVDESGTVTTNLTFDIGDATGNTVTAGTASNYKLLYRSGTSGDFTDQASGNSVANTDQVTFNSVSLQDGYYALGGTGDASLPVELTSFTARQERNYVVLEWMTESEIENLGFILYKRLSDEPQFKVLTDYRSNPALSGQGSTTFRTQYQYIDENVSIGKVYQYLLSDISYKGIEKKHSILTVKVNREGISWIPAFPNPFNPITRFTIQVGENSHLSIRVYDIRGREIALLSNQFYLSGEYELLWNGNTLNGKGAPSGIYFIEMRSDHTQYTQKVALLR